MKSKLWHRLLVPGIFIFSFGFTPLVFAQPQEESASSKTEVRKDHFEEWGKDLNLSVEQKEKLKQHRQESREKFQQIRQQLKEQNKALKAELDKTSSDPATLNALAATIKNLQGQMLDMRISQALFMKQTLTPEQLEKFRAKMKERMKERQEHGGKWGGRNGHKTEGKDMHDRDGGWE